MFTKKVPGYYPNPPLHDLATSLPEASHHLHRLQRVIREERAEHERDAEHLEALAMNADYDRLVAIDVRDGAQDRAMEYARRADDAVRDATNEREQRRNTEEKLRIVRLHRGESDLNYNVAQSQLQITRTVATQRKQDLDAAKDLLREARAAFEQSERERNDYARRLKAANADYIAVTKERDDAVAALTEMKPKRPEFIVGQRVRYTGQLGDGARCFTKVGATGTVTHADNTRNRFSVFFDDGSFPSKSKGAPQGELAGCALEKI